MALIKSVRGHYPTIPESCYLAESATVIGDVRIGEQCSLWFQTVLRGDVNSIRIGDQTNIQDGTMIHCTFQGASTTIGSRVSVGHKAIIHGCILQDEVLIGMGAIVMDHALVETGAIVAAGAVVPENTIVKGGYVYAGVPAKPLKPISEAQRAMIRRTATNYIKYAGWYGEE